MIVGLKDVPHKPGVYIYKDALGRVIYVGKAIDLKSRVASYFQAGLAVKTSHLVTQIKTIETVVVESELEALVLEANLIKKYLPAFNVRLTDDKDYLYIRVSKEPFPKVLTARKDALRDSLDYFGPFPSSRTVKETLKRLRKVFPWCSLGQRRQVSLVAGTKGKPCFYYHLGLCLGVCVGKVSREEYREVIDRFRRFMNGQSQSLIEELTRRMNQAAENLEFELASSLKRTIEGITYLRQPNRASVYLENPDLLAEERERALKELRITLNLRNNPGRIECFDVSNIQGSSAVGSMVVLTSGEIDRSQYRRFRIRMQVKTGRPNDLAMLREIVRRRLKNPWPKPQLMLIDGGIGQVRAVQGVLSEEGEEIPVLGLAKSREWLYSPSGEVLKLSQKNLGLKLLQKTRDEAHRFALSYHRRLRSKEMYNKSVGILK